MNNNGKIINDTREYKIATRKSTNGIKGRNIKQNETKKN